MRYERFINQKVTVIKDINNKQFFYTGKVIETTRNKIVMFDEKIKKVVYINMDNASIIPKD